MRLYQRLCIRVNRYRNAHSVRELSCLEDGCKHHIPGAFCLHSEPLRHGLPGLYHHRNLLHGILSYHQGNDAGDGFIGYGRNCYRCVVNIAGIHIARLQQSYLNRQGHNHFLLHEGVVHCRVVRVRAYMIGTELIGRRETEIERSIGLRTQMRLESEGR